MASAPSMRRIRGARSRNAVSMRVDQRSGGSKTWESDERIRAGSIACPCSPEGGHDVTRQQLEAACLQLRRNPAAGIELGHDAVQAELLAQAAQPFDHASRGAERHLLLEDVLVREACHALGLEPSTVSGAR